MTGEEASFLGGGCHEGPYILIVGGRSKRFMEWGIHTHPSPPPHPHPHPPLAETLVTGKVLQQRKRWITTLRYSHANWKSIDKWLRTCFKNILKILHSNYNFAVEQLRMRKFHCLLFELKQSYFCHYILCMTVPLIKEWI